MSIFSFARSCSQHGCRDANASLSDGQSSTLIQSETSLQLLDLLWSRLYGSERINTNDFRDPLAFPFSLTSRLESSLSTEISQHSLDRLAHDDVHIFTVPGQCLLWLWRSLTFIPVPLWVWHSWFVSTIIWIATRFRTRIYLVAL